jgi:hypothetical protein
MKSKKEIINMTKEELNSYCSKPYRIKELANMLCEYTEMK